MKVFEGLIFEKIKFAPCLGCGGCGRTALTPGPAATPGTAAQQRQEQESSR